MKAFVLYEGEGMEMFEHASQWFKRVSIAYTVSPYFPCCTHHVVYYGSPKILDLMSQAVSRTGHCPCPPLKYGLTLSGSFSVSPTPLTNLYAG